MVRRCFFVAMINALSVSTTAITAGNGNVLFSKFKCSMCHELSKRAIGPSLKEISAKYAEDKDAPVNYVKKYVLVAVVFGVIIPCLQHSVL
jgi:cytochrome c551/c552